MKFTFGISVFLVLTSCSKDDSDETESSNQSIPEKLLGTWDVIERYSYFHEGSISETPGYRVFYFDSSGDYSYSEYFGSNADMGITTGGGFTINDNEITLSSNETYIIDRLTEQELYLKDENDNYAYKMKKAPVMLYGKWFVNESYQYINGQVAGPNYLNPDEITFEFNSTADGWYQNKDLGFGASFNYELNSDILKISLDGGHEYNVLSLTESELILEDTEGKAILEKVIN